MFKYEDERQDLGGDIHSHRVVDNDSFVPEDLYRICKERGYQMSRQDLVEIFNNYQIVNQIDDEGEDLFQVLQIVKSYLKY